MQTNDEELPVFVPVQPYLEIGDYRIRFYRNGVYYDPDEMPEKFLIGVGDWQK